MPSREVGVRLRHARNIRGFSQEALGKAVGVSQAAISQLETGDSKSFKGTTLVAIAQILQIRADWLATGKGQMEGIDVPLPADAVRLARQWLKLAPEVRKSIAVMVDQMVLTSEADTPHVPDEHVAAAYGKPGPRNRK